MNLSGTFAVTGAGSGIGRGVAERLAEVGASVVLLDIAGDAVAQVADRIGGTSHRLDVSSSEQVNEVFARIGPLQGLVHCAGNILSNSVVAMSDVDWHRVTSVQLDGTFYTVRAAARSMLANETRDGTIVTLASINSTFGHRGLAAYAASKGGISMLVKVAALELASAGIRVNAVAPGIVETGMTTDIMADEAALGRWNESIPLGRIGRPDDIADAIMFLSSPMSRWMTGQTLSVDGGASLRVEPKMSSDDDWTLANLRAQL
jgi:NAD(P)-dependent dehydrogenase (short-subunit alcohol dehydrogenase family)